MQAVPHGCDAYRDILCLVSESAMLFNFGSQCDVILLFYSPIYSRCVKLSVIEEEILSAVIGSVRSLLRSGVERSRMNWAVPSICHEKLGARSHEVNADKQGDVELPSWVGDELEEPIPRVFEVAEPLWSR